MSETPINDTFLPTAGLSYNPNDANYFDAQALDGELHRSFDLCHSCRMCFKYCPSFPTLFDAIDRTDGNVREAMTPSVQKQVVDECFGCKLCYTNCPYTPSEQHPFQLDFPALILRARAQQRRENGMPWREWAFAQPDRLGKLGGLLPVLSNWANRSGILRELMHRLFGIHRAKQLPEFESESFAHWFHKHTQGRNQSATGTHKVVLFYTCYINYHALAIGRDAVAVLEHNDCQVACPPLNCCGMPALDGGDVDFAQAQAERNVNSLLPYVEQGYRVVAINPTCSLMLKQEYPILLAKPANPQLSEAANKVSAATRDLGEFLFELRQAGHFRDDFRSTPAGAIAYHVPCHLKKQNIGFRSRDMLRRIPQTKITLVDRCSAHDGTWAMKAEFFELSQKYGKAAFQEMQEAEAPLWVSDCPLAALQIEQATGKRPWHSIQVLARAYEPNGFPTPVVPPEPAPPST